MLHVTIPWNIDRSYACWPRELARYLIPFFGYSSTVETVCDHSVERWRKEKNCEKQWEAVWAYPAYTDYHRKEFADVLLGKGMERVRERQADFYVMGYEEFVPKVLAPYYKKMRTLTFFVSGKVPWQLEAYLQELSREEGIAADLKVSEDRSGYRNLRPEISEGSVVLDLSGEEKIMSADTAKGGIWIDMDSLESKKRKILTNSAETAYFSMKEEWGRLDTANKNGYNT